MSTYAISTNDIGEIKKTYKKKTFWRSVLNRYLKNKLAVVGMIIVVFMLLIAATADFISPYYYEDQHLADSLQSPNSQYWFGTDQFGRDILSRVIYGSRTSLLVGFFSVITSAAIGCSLGAISGYFGGVVDNLIMRAIDIILSIPPLLMAISISAMLGVGLINTVIAIAVSGVGAFARLTRASVLMVRDHEYIEAVHAVSASSFRIITKHIFPNIAAPLIVQFTLNVASCILAAAGLSFIGLGVQPPTPEWGAMLSAGRSYMRDNWWMTIFPGLAIMITVYGFNLMGDGLRDAMDPRLKT